MLPIAATFVPIEAVRTYANGTTEKCTSIFSYHILCGYAELPKLSDGSHNITVFAEYRANDRVGFDVRRVFFTVIDALDSSAGVADNVQNVGPDDEGNGSANNEGYPLGIPSVQSLLQPTTSPASAVPIFACMAAIVVAIFALAALVYLKKCKRQVEPSVSQLPLQASVKAFSRNHRTPCSDVPRRGLQPALCFDLSDR